MSTALYLFGTNTCIFCSAKYGISYRSYIPSHRLRTPREEIAFTARPKIHSHSQIFRYCRSIFCLPHRPNFSDIFDLCLHWVSVVRGGIWRKVACMINVCGFFIQREDFFVWVNAYVISNQRFTDRNMSEKYRFTFQMTSWSSKETSWFDLYFICLQ